MREVLQNRSNASNEQQAGAGSSAAAAAEGAENHDADTEDDETETASGQTIRALHDCVKKLRADHKALVERVKAIENNQNDARSETAAVKRKAGMALTLSDREQTDVVHLATAVYYARGGWNVRWSSDRSGPMGSALTAAIKHVRGEGEYAELDASTQQSLFKRLDYKIGNSFRVSFVLFNRKCNDFVFFGRKFARKQPMSCMRRCVRLPRSRRRASEEYMTSGWRT